MVVPIPTLPLESTSMTVEVANVPACVVPSVNKGKEFVDDAITESSPHGVEVPIPTLPEINDPA